MTLLFCHFNFLLIFYSFLSHLVSLAKEKDATAGKFGACWLILWLKYNFVAFLVIWQTARWQCLKFQHLAATPAGSESARFYKWMRGRCVLTALDSLSRISVKLWQLANLRLLSHSVLLHSATTSSDSPTPNLTPLAVLPARWCLKRQQTNLFQSPA